MKSFNLAEYLENPSRKVVTRDGRNVTIHCTNYQGAFPIVAEIEGIDFSIGFTNEGKYNYVDSSIYDLFFAPEKHYGWVNIYKNLMTGSMYCDCNIYASNEDAKKQHGIAIAKIEWEE